MKVTAIEVGKCHECSPCKHDVTVTFVDETKQYIGFFNAVSIADLYEKSGLMVPDHFKKYIGYVWKVWPEEWPESELGETFMSST